MLLVALVACQPPPWPTDTAKDTAVDDSAGVDSAGSCSDGNEACDAATCPTDTGDERMLPGSDCLTCHDDLVVAATIYTDREGTTGLSGAVFSVVDADGASFTFASNDVGNFVLTDPVVFPLDVSVTVDGATRQMLEPAPQGGCNSCHRCDGPPGGKLYAP